VSLGIEEICASGMPRGDRFLAFFEGHCRIVTGPLSGELATAAPFQVDFARHALADDVDIAILCLGRGNGKTALGSAMALAALMGIIDSQTKREVVIAARTLQQGEIAYQYVAGTIAGFPPAIQKRFTIRRAPRLKISYVDSGGAEHVLMVVASDARSALGMSPSFVLMDERGHWPVEKGDALESALLTGMAKRSGRCVMLSTSASDDLHSFSQWIDNPPVGCYVKEFRAAMSMPVDSEEAILAANPGALHKIGIPLKDQLRNGARALERGGSHLTQHRWLILNQRVADESRRVLVTVDEHMACETEDLPARQGPLIVGIDSAESASMAAAAYFWPESGRLEVMGWFPGEPDLLSRGQGDKVGDRYLQMAKRGELHQIGKKTIPVSAWLGAVVAHVHGQVIACLVSDKYKASQIEEGAALAGLNVPIVWRRFGFFSGHEDISRYRGMVLDQKIRYAPSLLFRSAAADSVIEVDTNLNQRLSKAKSLSRIDVASAAILAVAEGDRRSAIPEQKPVRYAWA
tara:strand:+ start:42936 stop:44492 length:1557 start_codon:yes stop_codon:yes gene_type:complete